jgi:hypothetical protein
MIYDTASTTDRSLMFVKLNVNAIARSETQNIASLQILLRIPFFNCSVPDKNKSHQRS